MQEKMNTTMPLLYGVETHIGRGGMPVEQLAVTKRAKCMTMLTERVSTFPSGEYTDATKS